MFLDTHLEPYPDERQWELLASVHRITPTLLDGVLTASAAEYQSDAGTRDAGHDQRTGNLFARLDSEGDDAESRSSAASPTSALMSGALAVTVADRIYVDRTGVPDRVQSRIRDIAAFSNPEYFRKKAARASTWNTPRVIRCSETLALTIALPRGCEAALCELARKHGVCIDRQDRRTIGSVLEVSFQGTLLPIQMDALGEVMSHDIGVLVLPTGVGKTVVATAAIAERARSTLVIVDRRPLLEQWRAQLSVFLGVAENDIGQLGAGKSCLTGTIDVAMVQAWRDSMPGKGSFPSTGT